MMCKGSQTDLADSTNEHLETRITREFSLQHQRVYEHPDQSFNLPAPSIGDWGANSDTLLPGVAVEQGFEGGKQGHKKRGARLLSQPLDRIRQIAVQREEAPSTTPDLCRRAGLTGGQFQY